MFCNNVLKWRNQKKYRGGEKRLNSATTLFQLKESAIRCAATFADPFCHAACVKVELYHVFNKVTLNFYENIV